MNLTISTKINVDDNDARNKITELLDKNDELYTVDYNGEIIIFENKDTVKSTNGSNKDVLNDQVKIINILSSLLHDLRKEPESGMNICSGLVDKNFHIIKDLIGSIRTEIDKNYVLKNGPEDYSYYKEMSYLVESLQNILKKMGINVEVSDYTDKYEDLPDNVVFYKIVESLIREVDKGLIKTISIYNESMVNKDEEIRKLEKALAYCKDVENVPDDNDDTNEEYMSNIYNILHDLGLV